MRKTSLAIFSLLALKSSCIFAGTSNAVFIRALSMRALSGRSTATTG